MIGIEMIGGIYCPLSPRDPKHRLHSLIQQTQSRLVLVHYLTKMKFNNNILLLDIDSILINNSLSSININNNDMIDQLSNVKVSADSFAYIIFTSGSTGTPKGVSLYIQRQRYYYFVFLNKF